MSDYTYENVLNQYEHIGRMVKLLENADYDTLRTVDFAGNCESISDEIVNKLVSSAVSESGFCSADIHIVSASAMKTASENSAYSKCKNADAFGEYMLNAIGQYNSRLFELLDKPSLQRESGDLYYMWVAYSAVGTDGPGERRSSVKIMVSKEEFDAFMERNPSLFTKEEGKDEWQTI